MSYFFVSFNQQRETWLTARLLRRSATTHLSWPPPLFGWDQLSKFGHCDNFRQFLRNTMHSEKKDRFLQVLPLWNQFVLLNINFFSHLVVADNGSISLHSPHKSPSMEPQNVKVISLQQLLLMARQSRNSKRIGSVLDICQDTKFCC